MADEPCLLVPVSLEALVVNQSDLHNTTWSNSARAYTGAKKYEPLEPPPFVRGNDRPRLGVTLHWALPDALTRGRRDKDGKLVFPFIPDRWLVVRTSPGKPLKAWVVESDFIGPAGSNLYPAADRGWDRIGRAHELNRWSQARNHTPFLTALGPGDQPAYTADVANLDNVLSFHDPLTDAELGVYSEGDDIDQPAVLSYQVIGWYASPALSDPLQNHERLGEGLLRGWRESRTEQQLPAEDIVAPSWRTAQEWKDVMAALGWSIGDELDLQQALGDGADPRVVYSSHTLCHGMVYGVNWTGRFKGAAQPYFRGDHSPFAETPIGSRSAWRSKGSAKGWKDGEFTDLAGPTRHDFPHIAIGNSTIDALAALAAHLLDTNDDSEHIATLFQALQYDLLHNYDQPGGQVELRQRIHQEWFAAGGGGSSWEVVAPRRNEPVEGEAEPNGMDVAQRLEKLGATTLLDQLNDKQRELDAHQRKLESLRRTLYELWWKSVRHKELSPKPELPQSTNLTGLLKEARQTVSDRETSQNELVDQRNVARDRLIAKGIRYVPPGEIPPEDSNTLQLHERPAARFFRPADPVVLVYGGKRSTRHGADGRWSEDNTLFCRFAGQTITSMVASTASRVADTQALKTAFDFAAVAWNKLPPQLVDPVTDLVGESLLLDPEHAPKIASLVRANAEQVRRRQRIIWGDHREQNVTVAAMTRAAGFRGVRPSPQAIGAWTQPWSPLYLCWRVTWYPSDANPGAAVSENWNFNGLDYDWAGLSGFDHSKAVTLQGRSLLTSTSTRAIQDSLRGLFDLKTGDDGDPALDKAALEKLRARLEDADLLSQMLSGFHDQLIQRDRTQVYDPPGQTKKLLGDIERLAPAPFRNGATGEAGHFYPLRAGHFRLQRLWVVDSFGQVFDPIKERGQTPSSFTPLRGSGMVTTGIAQRQDTQMLQLPPRLVQASRLQFRFSRPQGDEKSPVCGWLLPNHFDKSLVVYAPDGTALGAVLRVSEDIRWQPIAGGEQGPVDAIDEIDDPDIRDLIGELKSQGKLAFEDLLEAIDRTLWTTDPLGKRGSNLSTLIGRPIAVVRATLKLELAGDPVHDQLWEHTDQGKTHGFQNVELPVQLGHADLGDDGTIGFFAEDSAGAGGINYSQFRAVQPRIDLNEGTHYVVLPQDKLWPRVAANGKTVHLTLLLDPRGSVHARSGIVPVKAIRLPRHTIERPLERMDVTFRVGPVLNKPEGMRMPLPAEIQQGWSWIQQTGVNVWAEDEKIESATHHARLDDTPLHIREGWLKLSDALGKGDGDD